MDKNYIKFKAKCWYSDEDKTFYGEVPFFEGVFTDGNSPEEIKDNLIDIMTLHIVECEENGLDYNEFLVKNFESDFENSVEIIFFLPYEKSKIREVYKNKTLTIPTWLDDLARSKNLNFSGILQEALKRELNIIK